MFKRVEKRRRKKQEEEELGIDDELKEVMGIQDTDSEESESDSESDSDNDELGGDSDQGANESGSGEAFSGERYDSGGDEDEDEDEDPGITVASALENPVYVVSLSPDIKACIVCPGKLLKGSNMVVAHRASKACTLRSGSVSQSTHQGFLYVQAHERRYKQFKAIAASANSKDSAWVILNRHADENPKALLAPSATATSKRAEKKRVYLKRQKARREKIKSSRAKKTEKLTADATPEATPSKSNVQEKTSIATPPKKRRKLVEDRVLDSVLETAKASKPEAPSKAFKAPAKETGVEVRVRDIVRSTASRASAARTKSTGLESKKKMRQVT